MPLGVKTGWSASRTELRSKRDMHPQLRWEFEGRVYCAALAALQWLGGQAGLRVLQKGGDHCDIEFAC